MKCSIQRGEAELNGTFHLSPNENICSIARMENIHYLFYITCTKSSNFQTNLKEKVLKNDFSSSKQLHKLRVQLAENITRRLRYAKRTHRACCIFPA